MAGTSAGGPSYVDGLPEADYFGSPALSCSGAKKLLPPSCPALFRWERDNPAPPKKEFDFGHAAHALALGIGQPIDIIEADDWRKPSTREQRDLAYELGRIPCLRKDYVTVQAMADALRAHPQVGKMFAAAGERGVSERTLFWHDDEFDIDRRCRIDWGVFNFGGRVLLSDYKTTNSAAPAAFASSVANYSYHMQDVWYRAGARAVFDTEDVGFVFIAQEKTPPYIVQPYELDDPARRVGDAKNRRAMEVFAECSARDTWPTYSEDVLYLGLPAWADRDY